MEVENQNLFCALLNTVFNKFKCVNFYCCYTEWTATVFS